MEISVVIPAYGPMPYLTALVAAILCAPGIVIGTLAWNVGFSLEAFGQKTKSRY